MNGAGPDVFAIHAANYEPAYRAVRAAIARAVLEDAGHGSADPLELYAAAHRDEGSDWQTYLDVAGLAVAQVAREWLIGAQQRAHVNVPTRDSERDGFLLRVLEDALDLGDRVAWASVAEDFMPEPDALEGRQS